MPRNAFQRFIIALLSSQLFFIQPLVRKSFKILFRKSLALE